MTEEEKQPGAGAAVAGGAVATAIMVLGLTFVIGIVLAIL